MPGKVTALLLFCALWFHGACAQETTTQSLYWIRYQNQLIFSPTLYLNNEIDNRRFLGADVQNQLITHSRVHFRIGRWDVAGGLTCSWAYAQFPENPVGHATFEMRPVAEITYELPVGRWQIQQRIRVDNRFFEQHKDISVFEASDFTARFRYRLQLRIPVLKRNEKPFLIARLADEVMVNHRQNFFDQNRIYFSADFILSKKITIEPGYIYIHQQRFATSDFFNRHVMRFTLLHRIEL